MAGIEHDWRTAGLDARRVAMLTWVEKLTLAPADMTAADLEALRGAGWDDPEILEIAEVASYYAYVNRIADALGVAIEAPPSDPSDPSDC